MSKSGIRRAKKRLLLRIKTMKSTLRNMVQLAMAVAKMAEGNISRFSLTCSAMEEVTAVLETRPPSMPVRESPLSAPRMRMRI